MLFFFQAEDGIRDLVRSRGLGDVYKRQRLMRTGRSRFVTAIGRGLLLFAPKLMKFLSVAGTAAMFLVGGGILVHGIGVLHHCCLLYTSDAADERSSVDLGGRRIIEKKTTQKKKREKNGIQMRLHC